MCGCKGKCGCDITSTTKGEKGDPSPASSLGYKVYQALVSQSGTNAPTASILQNTTNQTISYSYVGVGIFRINTSTVGGFNQSKRALIIGCFKNADAVFTIQESDLGYSDNYFELYGLDETQFNVDGFDKIFFEIRIYP